MSDLFPPAHSEPEFMRFRRDEAQLAPGIRAIADDLGHAVLPLERFAGGSLPVYALGEALVLKAYPPFCISERDNETAVLTAIEDRLPTPTPRVRAVGEMEGWGYLLMSRLAGESLADAWPRIPGDERLRLAEHLGETLAALHAVQAPEVATVRIDWPKFVAGQQGTAVERQRGRGLDEHWLAQVPGFLASVSLDDGGTACLLHTEVMREHLLVQEGASGWRLSGLFDFEPAMAGAPEYEFASVGIFFSCGKATLLRRVLRAYGYDESRLDAQLERRLLAHAILHRYSDLPWYFSRIPVPDSVRSLDELAARWWGVE